MRRFAPTAGVLVALLAAPSGVAQAQVGPSARQALARAMARGMRQIGGASGAYVVDLKTGKALYAYAPTVGRPPASVEKLYTTSTALLRFGPDATLTTAIRGTGSIDGSGIWHGTLYLVGGGDPTFGSSSFDRAWYGTGATMQRLVANLLAATGIRGVRGAIVGDESYFDSLRGTPPTSYRADIADLEGELSALAYDRGFADLYGNVRQRRPALYAAQQLVAALRSALVKVPRAIRVYTGRAPTAARTLAVVHSPRIAKLIQLTSTPSDNFFAEMLLKGLGARFGSAGTTAAGVGVVRAETAARFGLHPYFVDGSGLSYADSTSPLQVVTLLREMAGSRPFYNSLAVAGETGTLKHYARGTLAQGNCHAKTGTLSDVANLAGYCVARDRHKLAFAVLADRVSDTAYVHAVEANEIAPALAAYDG